MAAGNLIHFEDYSESGDKELTTVVSQVEAAKNVEDAEEIIRNWNYTEQGKLTSALVREPAGADSFQYYPGMDAKFHTKQPLSINGEGFHLYVQQAGFYLDSDGNILEPSPYGHFLTLVANDHTKTRDIVTVSDVSAKIEKAIAA